jgi:hypothetical protein
MTFRRTLKKGLVGNMGFASPGEAGKRGQLAVPG